MDKKPKLGPNRGNAGKGRPKGVPNKTNAAIKDMVLAALDSVGGVEYLKKQAGENPTAFMGLLAKIMPTQITGASDGPIQTINLNSLPPEQLKALEAIGAIAT